MRIPMAVVSVFLAVSGAAAQAVAPLGRARAGVPVPAVPLGGISLQGRPASLAVGGGLASITPSAPSVQTVKPDPTSVAAAALPTGRGASLDARAAASAVAPAAALTPVAAKLAVESPSLILGAAELGQAARPLPGRTLRALPSPTDSGSWEAVFDGARQRGSRRGEPGAASVAGFAARWSLRGILGGSRGRPRSGVKSEEGTPRAPAAPGAGQVVRPGVGPRDALHALSFLVLWSFWPAIIGTPFPGGAAVVLIGGLVGALGLKRLLSRIVPNQEAAGRLAAGVAALTAGAFAWQVSAAGPMFLAGTAPSLLVVAGIVAVYELLKVLWDSWADMTFMIPVAAIGLLATAWLGEIDLTATQNAAFAGLLGGWLQWRAVRASMKAPQTEAQP